MDEVIISSTDDEQEDGDRSLIEQIKRDSLKQLDAIKPTSNSNNPDTSMTDIFYQGEDAKGFFLSSGESYIYPTNYPIRDYQRNIVHTCLFHNTLVSLPTGLGKTFIAAVVMYNFYRWYPRGKIIFMAPTRPLVSQQMRACYDIMGIPVEDTIELLGRNPIPMRKKEWNDKRMFYVTPQIIDNDLKNNILNPENIKCLVIDEAHKATKNYAYCQVVQQLKDANIQFRIVALSATPGREIADVVNLIRKLDIAKLELRSENSLDITPYTHNRKVESIQVPLSDLLLKVREEFLKIVDRYTKSLKQNKVLIVNTGTLSRFTVLLAKERYVKTKAQFPHINRELDKAIQRDFHVTLSLAGALEHLTTYGLRSFCQNLIDTIKVDGSCPMLAKDDDLKRLLELLEPKLNLNEMSKDYAWSHLKFIRLKELVENHFKMYNERGETTKIIIFANFRVVVSEIYEMLKTMEPTVKAAMFIGQSSGQKKVGITQQEQKEIMKKFREGEFNTIIATSVAEEGLDIGEVDLVICFEAHKSPIRLVQRIGRTGRKRNGRCVVLLTQGKEANNFQTCMQTCKNYVEKIINSKEIYANLTQGGPRMIPKSINPTMRCLHIVVKEQITPSKPTKSKDNNKKKKNNLNTLGKIENKPGPSKSKRTNAKNSKKDIMNETNDIRTCFENMAKRRKLEMSFLSTQTSEEPVGGANTGGDEIVVVKDQQGEFEQLYNKLECWIDKCEKKDELILDGELFDLLDYFHKENDDEIDEIVCLDQLQEKENMKIDLETFSKNCDSKISDEDHCDSAIKQTQTFNHIPNKNSDSLSKIPKLHRTNPSKSPDFSQTIPENILNKIFEQEIEHENNFKENRVSQDINDDELYNNDLLFDINFESHSQKYKQFQSSPMNPLHVCNEKNIEINTNDNLNNTIPHMGTVQSEIKHFIERKIEETSVNHKQPLENSTKQVNIQDEDLNLDNDNDIFLNINSLIPTHISTPIKNNETYKQSFTANVDIFENEDKKSFKKQIGIEKDFVESECNTNLLKFNTVTDNVKEKLGSINQSGNTNSKTGKGEIKTTNLRGLNFQNFIKPNAPIEHNPNTSIYQSVDDLFQSDNEDDNVIENNDIRSYFISENDVKNITPYVEPMSISDLFDDSSEEETNENENMPKQDEDKNNGNPHVDDFLMSNKVIGINIKNCRKEENKEEISHRWPSSSTPNILLDKTNTETNVNTINKVNLNIDPSSDLNNHIKNNSNNEWETTPTKASQKIQRKISMSPDLTQNNSFNKSKIDTHVDVNIKKNDQRSPFTPKRKFSKYFNSPDISEIKSQYQNLEINNRSAPKKALFLNKSNFISDTDSDEEKVMERLNNTKSLNETNMFTVTQLVNMATEREKKFLQQQNKNQDVDNCTTEQNISIGNKFNEQSKLSNVRNKNPFNDEQSTQCEPIGNSISNVLNNKSLLISPVCGEKITTIEDNDLNICGTLDNMCKINVANTKSIPQSPKLLNSKLYEQLKINKNHNQLFDGLDIIDSEDDEIEFTINNSNCSLINSYLSSRNLANKKITVPQTTSVLDKLSYAEENKLQFKDKVPDTKFNYYLHQWNNESNQPVKESTNVNTNNIKKTIRGSSSDEDFDFVIPQRNKMKSSANKPIQKSPLLLSKLNSQMMNKKKILTKPTLSKSKLFDNCETLADNTKSANSTINSSEINLPNTSKTMSNKNENLLCLKEPRVNSLNTSLPKSHIVHQNISKSYETSLPSTSNTFKQIQNSNITKNIKSNNETMSNNTENSQRDINNLEQEFGGMTDEQFEKWLQSMNSEDKNNFIPETKNKNESRVTSQYFSSKSKQPNINTILMNNRTNFDVLQKKKPSQSIKPFQPLQKTIQTTLTKSEQNYFNKEMSKANEKEVYVISSDDDFDFLENGKLNRHSVHRKESSKDDRLKCDTNINRIQKKSNRKNNKKPSNPFIEVEADESIVEGRAISSDDDLINTSSDQMDSSFIDDDNENDQTMANYLKSIKSPVGNRQAKYKIPVLSDEVLNMDVFSQAVQPDMTNYMNDSFCVSDENEETQNEEKSLLEIAELKLEQERKRKKNNREKKRRRVVRMVTSSSDEDG